MIIIAANTGEKIPYTINGTSVTFDDNLTLNLAKREQDWEVHIDICYDGDRELVIGAAAGRAYVAQIDIPERKHDEVPDVVDGEQTMKQIPISLDMETVTLILWAMKEEG